MVRVLREVREVREEMEVRQLTIKEARRRSTWQGMIGMEGPLNAESPSRRLADSLTHQLSWRGAGVSSLLAVQCELVGWWMRS